jgi:hypothetical protein
MVSFVADPDRVPALHRKMLAEIAKIRAGKVPAEDFDKVRETWKREHEEDLKKNEFWRRILARTYRRGGDIDNWLNIDPQLAKVNPETLKKAAPVFLPTTNRFDFVIEPDPEAMRRAAADKNKKEAEEAARKAEEAKARGAAEAEAARNAVEAKKRAEAEAASARAAEAEAAKRAEEATKAREADRAEPKPANDNANPAKDEAKKDPPPRPSGGYLQPGR